MESVNSSPSVIDTKLNQIDHLIRSSDELRTAASTALKAYLKTEAKKCQGFSEDGNGNRTPCNGYGACQSTTRTCFCDATHTGAACESVVIGYQIDQAGNWNTAQQPGTVTLNSKTNPTKTADIQVCNQGHSRANQPGRVDVSQPQ